MFAYVGSHLVLPLQHFPSLSNPQDLVLCGRGWVSVCYRAPQWGRLRTHTPSGGTCAQLCWHKALTHKAGLWGFYSAALSRRKTTTSGKLLDRSLTLDILMLSCALLIIVLKAFFFFIKRSTSSHSVLYSDNSLEFYVRLDCSSLEDAEVLLSFCGSTSFHSEQIIPHFQDKSSSGKSESIDYAPVTVGTGAYANHSAPV